MTIFNTLVMKPYRREKDNIVELFTKEQVLGGSVFQRHIGNVWKVAPTTSSEVVSQFNMPIIVPAQDKKGTPLVLIDTRPFERANGVITKGYEIDLMVERALIELGIYSDPEAKSALLKPVVATYSLWLSQSLVRNYNIGMEQEAIVRAGLSFFAWQFMYNEEEWRFFNSEDVSMQFTKFMVREMRFTPQVVSFFTESSNFIELVEDAIGDKRKIEVDEICELINLAVASPAFKISSGALINLVSARSGGGGSWFGFGSDFLVAAATEYPLALVQPIRLAEKSSTHGNTGIGNAVKSLGRMRIKTDSLVRWLETEKDKNAQVGENKNNDWDW